ncbi:ankyrin repeat and SOCS box protein 8-like [Eriocheir sinensis]|uniref:ankyrin repeat and SOCS box protein 8-like n=1 Tax=Eriocheir sinensis TaxID=95602 RepID=UPI0021C6DFF5|nr:ankyrin repeat and SOCS box protein 8-like [Eriocheir sinensis]
MPPQPTRARGRLGSSAPAAPTPEEKLNKLNRAISAIMEDDMRTVVSCIPGHIEVGKVYDIVLNASDSSEGIRKQVRASLLHVALHHRAFQCAKLLLHLGAPVEASESDLGDTALHCAARLGGHPFVTLLLQYGASPCSLNAANDTPLHLAAERGRVHSVCALLESGASPSAKNRYQETPWDRAVLAGTPSSLVCADLILTKHLQEKD